MIINFVLKRRKRRYANWFIDYVENDIENLSKRGGKIRRLTKEQKLEVYKIWGKVDINLHELIYSATGVFSPEYCPLVHFRIDMENVLNDQRMAHAWSDKNYYDKFFPSVEFPESIVRNINGIFFDKNYKIISESEAISLIKNEDSVIIKPSIDSYCGTGVSKYNKEDNFHEIFCQYGKNFVVQKILKQYKPLAILNPSSVNIIRYNTLYWNDRVYPLSATLRIGTDGIINDNYITEDGRGMVIIGINADGNLKDKAYYACGEKLDKAPNGSDFKDILIPNFNTITDIVVSMHEQMPQFGFIGFDIAIKEDGTPVVMEYNIKVPGIMYYQYVNGPLFGNLTKEVARKFKKE